MCGALVSRGEVVAVALDKPLDAGALSAGDVTLDSFATRTSGEAAGWWLDETWDIVRLLPEMLAADAAVLASEIPDEPLAHVSVLGEHRLAAARGSYFEPHVVVDTTAGDVVVAAGTRISAFTRLAGPIVIGEGVQVNGGRISCCSIGAHSRVAGEMSVTVMLGHANKAHDGFVGHSIIGRWANLGAGTTTSNLKNNYGSIRVHSARGEHDTGMQYLGSLIGDHVKTAIGTRLNTGTMVGAGANVFGDRSPEKRVPPFAWGDRAPFASYELDRFLAVAALVMKRRHVVLSAGMRDTLAAAWKAAQR
jgi:UDP-N-acetylglucosamine diphosphorylase/glucosamine-1-phosphate N-acetyltransferase